MPPFGGMVLDQVEITPPRLVALTQEDLRQRWHLLLLIHWQRVRWACQPHGHSSGQGRHANAQAEGHVADD